MLPLHATAVLRISAHNRAAASRLRLLSSVSVCRKAEGLKPSNSLRRSSQSQRRQREL